MNEDDREPCAEVQQYLEDRYGEAPDFKPYNCGHRNAGLYIIHLCAVDLKFHANADDMSDWMIEVEVQNFNVADPNAPFTHDALSDACDEAGRVANGLLGKQMQKLEGKVE